MLFNTIELSNHERICQSTLHFEPVEDANWILNVGDMPPSTPSRPPPVETTLQTQIHTKSYSLISTRLPPDQTPDQPTIRQKARRGKKMTVSNWKNFNVTTSRPALCVTLMKLYLRVWKLDIQTFLYTSKSFHPAAR